MQAPEREAAGDARAEQQVWRDEGRHALARQILVPEAVRGHPGGDDLGALEPSGFLGEKKCAMLCA